MVNYSIQDESSNHKYYTQIPNIIFQIGLKANQIALYLAIKKSAGDYGYCTKSSAKLCQEAGIGVRNFPKIKQSLAQVNKFLKSPLIIVTPRLTDCGDSDTDLIVVVDIWNQNMQHFLDKTWGGAKLQVPGAKLQGGVPAKMRGGGAKLQDKEEPIKKNLYEEQQQAAAVFFDCLVQDTRLTPENRKVLMKFSEQRIKLAQEYSYKVKANTTLIQQLMWHCALEKPPELPKKNFWDAVREHFKNNEKYNSAICFITNEEICFERGLTHLAVKFAEAGAREKFLKHMDQFKIKWSFDG